MADITSEMKVGEIVRIWPQTMQVFRSHGLNLQWGGNPLRRFCRRQAWV